MDEVIRLKFETEYNGGGLFLDIKDSIEGLSTVLSSVSVVFVIINFYYLQKHNRESDYMKLKQDVTTNLIKMIEIHYIECGKI